MYNCFNDNNYYIQQKRPNTTKKPKELKFGNNNKKITHVADDIMQLKNRREQRNRHNEEKKFKNNKKKINLNLQKFDDDFNYLIQKKKFQIEYQPKNPYKTSEFSKIFVCVRKRPIFQKEIMEGEIDCISAVNPKVFVYDCKIKIDGYTKYIDVNEFNFDNAFNENDNTLTLYRYTIQPSLNILARGGVITCFAYGQTGSGKTYTMKGIQDYAIENLFQIFRQIERTTNKRFTFYISFFEIYLGILYDLLNKRNKLMALEDKNQKVQIFGLTEKEASSPSEMKSIIEFANQERTTHNTVTNETSSRSHAICNFIVKLRNPNYETDFAKLSLVDLAGSERATETQSNDKNRLAEGADINKSLLALKECIRALDARKIPGNNEHHVPFRNSKLTLVLRDSFLGKENLCKIIMISCISPSNHSANHTINTLRYTTRLKEKKGNVGNNNIIKKKNINLKKDKIGNKSPNIQRFGKNNMNKLYLSGLNIDKFSNSNKNIKCNSYYKKIEKKGNKNQTGNTCRKSLQIVKGKNLQNNNQRKKLNLRNNIHQIDVNKKFIERPKKGIKKINISGNYFHRAETSVDKVNNINHKRIKYFSNPKDNKTVNNTINQIGYVNYVDINLQNQYNVPNNYIFDQNIYSNRIFINNRNIDVNTDIDPRNNDDYIKEQIEVIKSEEQYLADDGNLISKFKGLTKNNPNRQIYQPIIQNIIESKKNYVNKIQKNINEYKNLIK